MMKHSYRGTLDYLFGLQNSGIKLGLERIERLVDLLGYPMRAYPTVLIGGTNGKGSVSAMMASVLTGAGYRVGLYSSPHLVRFNERIRVDDVEITDAELVDLAGRIRGLLDDVGEDDELKRNTDLSPSFFEFTTALAMEYFKERSVDIALLEVGLGGRLDATNVADADLSIITGIGLDHTSTLGADITLISGEKAGIIKENKVVVTGPLDPEARRVIERISKERSSKVISAGRDFTVEAGSGGEFDYRGDGVFYKGLSLALIGPHQQENAGVAISALGLLAANGFSVTPEDVRNGLKDVRWPGRCEIVRRAPTLMLDCAHNESAARALALSLDAFTYDRLILVLGIMSDKDIDGILMHLIPRADSVIFTKADVERSEEPRRLLDRFNKLPGKGAEAALSDCVAEAVEIALGEAQDNDMVCITGSVFIVGEAKTFFEKTAT